MQHEAGIWALRCEHGHMGTGLCAIRCGHKRVRTGIFNTRQSKCVPSSPTACVLGPTTAFSLTATALLLCHATCRHRCWTLQLAAHTAPPPASHAPLGRHAQLLQPGGNYRWRCRACTVCTRR